MTCPKCGTWNNDYYNYCYNCGAKLHLTIGTKLDNHGQGDYLDIAFVSSDIDKTDDIVQWLPRKKNINHKRNKTVSFISILILVFSITIFVFYKHFIFTRFTNTEDHNIQNPSDYTNSTDAPSLPMSPLTIIDPANGYAEVSTNSYILKMCVLPNSKVLINDIDFSQLVKADGSLEASISLPVEGINNIEVSVQSPDHIVHNNTIHITRLPASKESTVPQIDEQQYIQQAWNIPYKQLIEYPRVYQHKIGLFKGQIENLAVQNNILTFELRLSSSERIYVEYDNVSTQWNEGDKVKLYGEVNGTANSLPRVEARYIYRIP